MIRIEGYVPVLKARAGEALAVAALPPEIRHALTPLFEICPPEYDFETESLPDSIDDHMAKVAQRILAKWGFAACLVDLVHFPAHLRMDDGTHPVAWLLARLRGNGVRAVPVTGLDRDPEHDAAAKREGATGGFGLGLRIGLDVAAEGDLDARMRFLAADAGVGIAEIDVVLDLADVNFEPLDGLRDLVWAILRGAPTLGLARSLTVAASAFPRSMGAIKGTSEVVSRGEWLLHKALRATATPGDRLPGFGDYAVNAPGYASLDMRRIKTSATIRYAIEDGWLIVKGKNIRDNGCGQFRDLSLSVRASPHFAGVEFSNGSAYIDLCRQGAASTGNSTTWRRVGTDQHLTRVVRDLATLNGS